MSSVNTSSWPSLLDSIKKLDEKYQLVKYQAEEAFQQLMAIQVEMMQQFGELQQAETERRKQLEYTNTMVDNLNEMFYTYDQDIRLTFINMKSIELLGYRPGKPLPVSIVADMLTGIICG